MLHSAWANFFGVWIELIIVLFILSHSEVNGNLLLDALQVRFAFSDFDICNLRLEVISVIFDAHANYFVQNNSWIIQKGKLSHLSYYKLIKIRRSMQSESHVVRALSTGKSTAASAKSGRKTGSTQVTKLKSRND